MIKVSIIVPVYQGDEFIIPFFSYFKFNQLPSNIELIIIDNGSNQDFYSNLLEISKKINNCKILSYNEKKSSYAARNFGSRYAKGDILAFTDFDCKLTKKYIIELQKLSISDFDMISGKIKLFHIKNNIYEIFDRYAYLKQDEYFKNNYAATANLVVKKDIFLKLRGFKEVFSGGDNDFCKRAYIKGYFLNFNNKLIVKHPLRSTLNDHLNKAKRLGIGYSQLFKINKKNTIKNFFFITKTLIGLLFPFHQLQIFLKIILNEKVDVKNILPLLKLCFIVGFYQRIQIFKNDIF